MRPEDFGLSSTAMVLAAGLGTRMRPLTLTTPKPLVRVTGRTMLDQVLDRVAEAGISRAVVNVHHHADQMEAHLARRRDPPATIISDERDRLLDSGGGTKKALPHLGGPAFLLANADTLWIDGAASNVRRLVAHWRPQVMDVLLLLAATATAVGFEGRGDFHFAPDGRILRRGERDVAPFAYAGFAIFATAAFAETPDGPFSLNLLFDRAAKNGRLHGVRLDGVWMHVGTPDSIVAAEERVARSLA